MTERLEPGQAAAVLRPVLDYLANHSPERKSEWDGWRISRVGGGTNNLIYRATGPAGDLAVKFTLRDRRDRASREYNALLALHQAGIEVAPRPLFIDRCSYFQPVVVQTWMPGTNSAAMPANDGEWTRLLEHFAAIHSLTPGRTSAPIKKAFLNFESALAGKRAVRQELKRLPQQARPAELITFVDKLDANRFPSWPRPSPALCRVDPNITNFIRQPERWVSVDWENSGWGDPAFELADLMAHPAYRQVSPDRWEWAAAAYCNLTGDSGALERIWVYYQVMLVWWLARFCRYLYEIPRGLDRRLVNRPADWEADIQEKYQHYLELVKVSLNRDKMGTGLSSKWR